MISITAAWLAAGIATTALAAPPAAFDTTFGIPSGARVEIDNFAGSVIVRTWDRDAVRVVANRAMPDRRIRIRSAGAVVRIDSESQPGHLRTVDYEITIPASAPVRISGPYNDVAIEGAGADISVETVQGDIRVRGGNGQVTLRSVEGKVSLERARGRITLAAVNSGVSASEIEGDISASTVNGDVRLAAIRSGDVSASTVNGTLSYDGTIRDQGRYAFTTHNGDLILIVPDGANAAISISTYNGRVESAFPVTLTQVRGGQRLHFTIGSGSAQIELESFNGVVHLRRPGGART